MKSVLSFEADKDEWSKQGKLSCRRNERINNNKAGEEKDGEHWSELGECTLYMSVEEL